MFTPQTKTNQKKTNNQFVNRLEQE